MTVRTLNKMDIMRAPGGFEGGVHGFHIEAAIGEARVAGGAGNPRFHAVIGVAGEATEAFMNAHGSAVVAGAHLAAGLRRVALVAERLARIAADLHRPLPFAHLRQGQFGQRNGLHFAPVEERDGRPAQFLRCAG